MNGLEKFFIGIPIAIIGWFEWRIRGKVNGKFCDERSDHIIQEMNSIKKEVQAQGDRIIDYLINGGRQ